MWEETLVFTLHMPEIALIRFLVWDHDPIGRDFIGQRTIAFSSMMPGKTEMGNYQISWLFFFIFFFAIYKRKVFRCFFFHLFLLVSFAHSVSGYRHVYLEGIEEASIFVHVAINDICGKVSAVRAMQFGLHV